MKTLLLSIMILTIISCGGETKKKSACEGKSCIIEWGSNNFDNSPTSMATDKDGNSYIVGTTQGDFESNKEKGGKDIFITKVNSNADKIWSKLLGGAGHDFANYVAVDDENNIYITGSTKSSLDGNQNSGGLDIFLYKLNSKGETLWAKLLGSDSDDEGLAIAIANDKIYLTGYVSGKTTLRDTHIGKKDIIIASFDSSGELLWSNHFGTTDDEVGKSIVVTDSIYVTGENNLLTKVSLDGELDFIKEGEGNSLAKLDDNIYLTTEHSLIKFTNDGEEVFSKELFKDNTIIKNLIVVDDTIYLTGETDISLDKINISQAKDVFLVKLDKNGDNYWTKQWGTTLDDNIFSLSFFDDNLYLLGSTKGSFNKKSNTKDQIFLIKFYKSDIKDLYKPCEETLCSNHGFCSVVGEDIICNCEENYLLHEKISCLNPCEGEICTGHGNCKTINALEAICECDDGFFPYELNCFNPCDGETCSGKGDCAPITGIEAKCICDEGFYPYELTCSNPCNENSCSGNGECTPITGVEASCICDEGFTSYGDNCWTENINEFGTSGSDFISDSALDSEGNIYIIGTTEGNMNGANLGNSDIFLSKFDKDDFSLVWSKQFGSDGYDYGNAIDIKDGNIYIAGGIAVSGKHSQGFLAKYDKDGNEIWRQIYGDIGNDSFKDLVVADGIYVIGETPERDEIIKTDILLVKYDNDGNQKWKKTWGGQSEFDNGKALTFFNNNIYTLSKISIASRASDVGIKKFDTTGKEIWRKNFGTNNSDIGNSIIVTTDNIYVVGVTYGSFTQESDELAESAFFAKLDNQGDVQLVKQWSDYKINSMISSLDGGFYLTGKHNDTFLLKINDAGDKLWEKEWNLGVGSSITTNDTSTFLTGNSSQDNLFMISIK